MKNKGSLIISCLACLIPVIIGLFLYNDLPNQLAIHWDDLGKPDNFLPKSIAIFFLPILAIILIIVLINASNKSNARGMNSSPLSKILILFFFPVFLIFGTTLAYMHALNYQINFGFTLLLIGILFIIIGNYLPEVRQNRLVGLKTSWTLNSEENWNKTQRVAGYLFIINGLIHLVCFGITFINQTNIIYMIPFICLLVSIAIMFLYSYLIRKK